MTRMAPFYATMIAVVLWPCLAIAQNSNSWVYRGGNAAILDNDPADSIEAGLYVICHNNEVVIFLATPVTDKILFKDLNHSGIRVLADFITRDASGKLTNIGAKAVSAAGVGRPIIAVDLNPDEFVFLMGKEPATAFRALMKKHLGLRLSVIDAGYEARGRKALRTHEFYLTGSSGAIRHVERSCG